MAVLGARPVLAANKQTQFTSLRGLSLREEKGSSCSVSGASASFRGSLSSSAAEVNERFCPGECFGRLSWAGLAETVDSRSSGAAGKLVVVGRSGGSRPPAGARRPRMTGPRRTPQEENQSDGPLLNQDIRVPEVRLLDEEQKMVGVVPTQEALQRSRDADLDLVMISPDADPPVCRIMDYSKYRYELQKKKREAQKKAAASRQELKELKMRYNIDTHDYDVRLRAAQRFLKDGDKVKVVCQFKGREMDFKDLAFKLFERFADDIAELGVMESKMAIEGRSMNMILGPNKAAVAKLQAQAQSAAEKRGAKGQEAENTEVPKSEAPASV